MLIMRLVQHLFQILSMLFRYWLLGIIARSEISRDKSHPYVLDPSHEQVTGIFNRSILLLSQGRLKIGGFTLILRSSIGERQNATRVVENRVIDYKDLS